jgi:hypothetical protein
MYIDCKITTWDRAKINDEEDKKIVLNAIKEGKLRNESDLAQLDIDIEWETLNDVSENMTVEENDGFATLEVFNDENKSIHANGKN